MKRRISFLLLILTFFGCGSPQKDTGINNIGIVKVSLDNRFKEYYDEVEFEMDRNDVKKNVNAIQKIESTVNLLIKSPYVDSLQNQYLEEIIKVQRVPLSSRKYEWSYLNGIKTLFESRNKKDELILNLCLQTEQVIDKIEKQTTHSRFVFKTVDMLPVVNKEKSTTDSVFYELKIVGTPIYLPELIVNNKTAKFGDYYFEITLPNTDTLKLKKVFKYLPNKNHYDVHNKK
jgi:hypothetical protein